MAIRLYAFYQVALGQPSRKLEEFFKQITNWVHPFESEGIEGLRDKKRLGRTSRLTNSQLNCISALVLELPANHGYSSAT